MADHCQSVIACPSTFLKWQGTNVLFGQAFCTHAPEGGQCFLHRFAKIFLMAISDLANRNSCAKIPSAGENTRSDKLITQFAF
jgi:hypothetical protein